MKTGICSARALGVLCLLSIVCFANAATTPKVGDAAPNFTLQTLDNKSVELQQFTATQAVVLVVLRGWPGYQCPDLHAAGERVHA